MTIAKLRRCLAQIIDDYQNQYIQERLLVANLLVKTAALCVEQLRGEMRENHTWTSRRKAKRRETASDPKPPVKPVRVAEPSKPKKPKYSGNHAPSARR